MLSCLTMAIISYSNYINHQNMSFFYGSLYLITASQSAQLYKFSVGFATNGTIAFSSTLTDYFRSKKMQWKSNERPMEPSSGFVTRCKFILYSLCIRYVFFKLLHSELRTLVYVQPGALESEGRSLYQGLSTIHW